MKTVQDALESFKNDVVFKKYKIYKCEHCNNEMLFKCNPDEEQNLLDIELYEPKDVTYEYYDVKDFKMQHPKTSKLKQVSSDSSKDIFVLKCSKCGHIQRVPRSELKTKFDCDSFNKYGQQNLLNVYLDEVEEQRAYEFIEKHNHNEELARQGKLGFTTLGMQFSYIITPGGLGNSIVIKCNYCGKTLDITNIDNW